MAFADDLLIAWQEERTRLQQHIERLETGALETMSRTLGGDWVDTTADRLKDCQRKIAIYDKLIARHSELTQRAPGKEVIVKMPDGL